MQKIKPILVLCFLFFLSSATLIADVRTQFDDVEITISGKTEIQGIGADDFFRALQVESDWEYYLVADFTLAFDVRFTTELGIYFAFKNQRYKTENNFGEGITRAKGMILGTQDFDIYMDELFIDLTGVILRQLSIKAGLIHTKIGLDTSLKGYFDGHGSPYFDSSTGRLGEFQEIDMYPAGLQATWDTESSFKIRGGWFLLRKDPDNFENDIQMGFIEAKYGLSESSMILGGFATWLEKGNYYNTSYVAIKTKIDSEFSTYGAGYFQSGSGITATGFYIAIRYASTNSQLFFDISYWYLEGNSISSRTDENFRSTASLKTTMIIDDADVGYGLSKNCSAFKVVMGFKLSYMMELLAVGGFYSPLHSAAGSDPGDEIDLKVRAHFGDHLLVEAAAGYLFGSDIFSRSNEAWLFMIRIVASF